MSPAEADPDTDTDTEPEGAALIDAIISRAEQRGLTRDALADELGFASSYLRALSSGARPVKGLSEARLRQIAAFLNIPLVQVMMLAGILKPEDFVTSDRAALDNQLERGHQRLREDPLWGYLAPTHPEWSTLSPTLKLLVVLLYEQVAKEELIEKAKLLTLLPAGDAGGEPGA